MKRSIQKMVVAAVNASGEPDLFFCKISCTPEEVDDGKHYDMAKQLAIEEGYEPKLAYDTQDMAGKAMYDALFDKTKPKVVIDITGGLVQSIDSEIDLDVVIIDYEDVSEEEANASIFGDLAYVILEFPVEVVPEHTQNLYAEASKDWPEVDLREKAEGDGGK
jgi:hypothetical protein